MFLISNFLVPNSLDLPPTLHFINYAKFYFLVKVFFYLFLIINIFKPKHKNIFIIIKKIFIINKKKEKKETVFKRY